MRGEEKRLLYRLTFKIIFFAILMFVIGIIEPAVLPVINNDMYLTQMENSDAYFVALETYNRIKPMFDLVKTLIGLIFIGIISVDGVKLYRNLTKPDPEKT